MVAALLFIHSMSIVVGCTERDVRWWNVICRPNEVRAIVRSGRVRKAWKLQSMAKRARRAATNGYNKIKWNVYFRVVYFDYFLRRRENSWTETSRDWWRPLGSSFNGFCHFVEKSKQKWRKRWRIKKKKKMRHWPCGRVLIRRSPSLPFPCFFLFDTTNRRNQCVERVNKKRAVTNGRTAEWLELKSVMRLLCRNIRRCVRDSI